MHKLFLDPNGVPHCRSLGPDCRNGRPTDLANSYVLVHGWKCASAGGGGNCWQGPNWPHEKTAIEGSFTVMAANLTTRSQVASAAAVCRKTELSNSELSALSNAWRSTRKLSPHLRLVVDRFGELPLAGRCGSTSWAYAYFLPSHGEHLSSHDQIQEQDGPDVFRRLADGPWQDVGSTGGATPCHAASYDQGLPEALVKDWGLRCT